MGVIATPHATNLLRVTLQDYDLAATLSCGQAFRWKPSGSYWEAVIGSRWVRLASIGSSAGNIERMYSRTTELVGETAEAVYDWQWLTEYLQLDVDLSSILASFPQDEPMRQAVASCRGLRLLRQPPWECLASFILSSTKQIVQIQQIIALLCQRFGEPVPVLPGHSPAFSFPSPERIAACDETELRACKMGFRAPYLLETAKRVCSGEVDLNRLHALEVEEARACLMRLHGVGRKIADCVLLFGCGFQNAFPVDVWVMRGLRELYFRNRRVKLPRLQRFSRSYFGPFGGYAQQYLFHFMRTRPNP